MLISKITCDLWTRLNIKSILYMHDSIQNITKKCMQKLFSGIFILWLIQGRKGPLRPPWPFWNPDHPNHQKQIEPEQWVVWKNLSETTICKKKLFVKTCKVWKKSSSLFAKNVSWRIKNDLQNCKNLAAKKICKRLIQKDYDYIVHSKYLITYLHQQPPFQEKPCLKDHRYLSDLLSFPHR